MKTTLLFSLLSVVFFISCVNDENYESTDAKNLSEINYSKTAEVKTSEAKNLETRRSCHWQNVPRKKYYRNSYNQFYTTPIYYFNSSSQGYEAQLGALVENVLSTYYGVNKKNILVLHANDPSYNGFNMTSIDFESNYKETNELYGYFQFFTSVMQMNNIEILLDNIRYDLNNAIRLRGATGVSKIKLDIDGNLCVPNGKFVNIYYEFNY